MTYFINSRLGNLVESNRRRIQEFTNKAENQTKELSRTADAHNSRYNLASARSARKYGTPVDIARLLKELYEQGYYGNIAYNKAVDGIWGKLTQDALNRRTYKEEIDNSLKAKVQRVAANPVVKTLNNMFPFGYDNSTISSKTTNTLNSITRGKFSGATNRIGRLIGTFGKLFKGVTNTDKAGQAMIEFADLDLSKPQNRKRAEELWRIANKEEPRWGHITGSLERRQKVVRARIDQNYLHGGFPQKYNIFSKAAGYTTRSNSRTYGYSDPEMKRIEQEYIKNYIRTNKPTKRTDDGQYIWKVSGGDPYVAHGDFSIIASDLKGTDARSYDEWDYGFKEITSNHLPGMKKVLIGIKAN